MNSERNVYVRCDKMRNVKGRIYYISSAARQEHLYATYDTVDRSFWSKLARENQKEFRKSGTEGECIEARELVIALPEKFAEYEPNELLRDYTEAFKNRYGVECTSALHHNKAMTNYHIHLIFSERKILEEPERKAASRNMYYDESGKKVRTKKEVTDENGNLREGCSVIKKGEVYEEKLFEKKNPLFKQEHFLDEIKQFYVDKMNHDLNDDKHQMKVFDKAGPYLPLQKIGKNNPKTKQIRESNKQRLKWNNKVSQALYMDIPAALLVEIKRTEVTEPIKSAIKDKGTATDKILQIMDRAITTLGRFISRLLNRHLRNVLTVEHPNFILFVENCRPKDNKIKDRKRDVWER